MTGWTWDQVRDQLDMPRVYALRAAWKDNPPLAITMRLVAEANGVKFEAGSLVSHSDGSGGGHAPMPDPSVIMAEIGQSEPIKYIPPRRGVIVEQESGLAPGEDCA